MTFEKPLSLNYEKATLKHRLQSVVFLLVQMQNAPNIQYVSIEKS